MLNQYSFWKYLLILVVIGLGGLYAAPNLYPDDPAIQVSFSTASGFADERLLRRVERALDDAEIGYTGSDINERNVLVRFTNAEAQLRGKSVVERSLGENYLVALNLAPTTPEWLSNLGAQPMKLGLDLRGGVHFLMEVDMESALDTRLKNYIGQIRTELREAGLRYRSVVVTESQVLSVKFADAEVRDKAATKLRSTYDEFMFDSRDDVDGYYFELSLLETEKREIEDYAITQNLTTLRNRVNELGVAEPLVQRQGRDRIVVELPGIQDASLAKQIIGATANLEFRLEARADELKSRTEVFAFRDPASPEPNATIEEDLILTGSNVSNASSSFDENGQPQVNITLDSTGGKLMNRATKDNVGRRMAVLFIEYKSRAITKRVDGEEVETDQRYEEKSLISLATIQTALGYSFRITGLDSPQESSQLALLLRAGSLAAPIYFVEERTVGPSLGQKNIDKGIASVQIGLLLVVLFMILYYRVFGIFATAALGLNLVILIAVMSMISATLTLPGIAGIVLTVGMAVDANVLIFARIREELKKGVPPQSAIHGGYARAFETIFDANITTLLVAVILFAVGTGPVKGFAVTLSIGIVTSMFTAIVVTRAMVNLVYGGRRNLKQLWI